MFFLLDPPFNGRPQSKTKEFDYDPLMRVKQITAKDPAANPVLNYTYEYDRMDNITAKATEHGDYGYTYDDLYRLTDADTPVSDDEAFTYDNVGNRLTSADSSTEWNYNENNELGGYDDVTYDYDLNGNMIEKNAGGVVTKFFYNLEDRLERVEDGSGNVIAEYYYDPFGRRLWKDVGGTRTCFHYSDEGLVGEYDATGTVIKTYGWKPGFTWSTDPLFMKIGSAYYFYHNDHLGTPQKMTSASGAVVWSATYSSFGEASIDTETVENNLRFPGQYFDAETGLHYNYHRYYDPSTGRYLTPDPIGLAGGINLFAYVQNNPLKFIDHIGLLTFHFYGNWGGPGWTSGKWKSWDEFTPDEKRLALHPIDSLDECFMHHDICYGDTRDRCRYSLCDANKCYKNGFNKCDKELISRLRKLNSDWPGDWPKPPKSFLDKIHARNKGRVAIPAFEAQIGARNITGYFD